MEGNKKFVQLGERRKNGQIAKNEQYSIEEFFGKIFASPAMKMPKITITLIDILFYRKKTHELIESKISKVIENTIQTTHREMMRKAIELINQDNFGKKKARTVKAALEGKVSEEVPASILQKHKDAVFVLDREAASMLSETPIILVK